MTWLAINEDGTELIYKSRPTRMKNSGIWIGKFISSNGFDEMFEEPIELPVGTIKKLIGKELTWKDEPVELK